MVAFQPVNHHFSNTSLLFTRDIVALKNPPKSQTWNNDWEADIPTQLLAILFVNKMAEIAAIPLT